MPAICMVHARCAHAHATVVVWVVVPASGVPRLQLALADSVGDGLLRIDALADESDEAAHLAPISHLLGQRCPQLLRQP